MNLWIINHYANGPNSVGVTRHFDLAKELVRKGHKVTIFAASYNHWTKTERFNYKKDEFFHEDWYEGVKFLWFKTTPYTANGFSRVKNMFSFYFSLRKFNFKNLNEKPDFILGSILQHFSGWVAYKLAKTFNAKFIFEERDLWPQTLIDLGKLTKRNPIVKILAYYETFMYRKADKIIVLFDKADQYVMSKGVPKRKVVYLPNGTDLNRFSERHEVNELNDVLPLLKNKIVIGYIGAHSLANNMSRIIEFAEIMQKDDRFIFLFVGDGTYKNQLISEVKEKNIQNCIFINAVTKEKIPTILTEFDYGIISLKDSPVYKYGFSLNKLYDYLGAKLPVILDTTIMENVVNINEIGFSSSNLDELSQRVISITEEEENKLSLNAYNYLIKEHSWQSLAEKFEKEIFNIKGNN